VALLSLVASAAIVGLGTWAFEAQSRRMVYEGPQGGIPTSVPPVYVQTGR
jgi:hypothetical protein